MNTPLNAEKKGILGRVYENGHPVVYKLANEIPSSDTRYELAWLTVISWKYDGKSNNGMPEFSENKRMIKLEDTIEDNIKNDNVLRHAYSRTGNNLKELVYYTHNRDQFLKYFNKALENQPKYPIEIKFYEDKTWDDLQRLLNDFNKKRITKAF